MISLRHSLHHCAFMSLFKILMMRKRIDRRTFFRFYYKRKATTKTKNYRSKKEMKFFTFLVLQFFLKRNERKQERKKDEEKWRHSLASLVISFTSVTMAAGDFVLKWSTQKSGKKLQKKTSKVAASSSLLRCFENEVRMLVNLTIYFRRDVTQCSVAI